jgi:predicted MFS family arabinose efflux permease
MVLPLLGVAESPLALGVMLVALGAAVGTMDVAMNIAGVTAIRRTGRAIMPVFHAAFSFGALIGSAGAAVAAAHDLSPLRHLTIVAIVGAVAALAIARWIPVEELLRQPVERGHTKRPLTRRPVLWLLGCVALCSSIAEGASADWSAFFGVHERGLSEASGALVYSAFSIAMAFTRLGGERIERRWGPQRMLVAGSTIGGLGLFVAVLAPSPVFAFIGFAFAGAGLAYAFPVALEMGGAVGRRADGGGGERELAFVTTIAYSGFLFGPPMVGGIAQLTSLPLALGFVGVVALLIGPLALVAAAARRREGAPSLEAVGSAPSR